MTNEEMKNWIDNASYYSLLAKWRSSPSGSPFFQGEIGQYYKEVLARKRDADPGGAVDASKSIGW